MAIEFNGIQTIRENHYTVKFKAMQGDYVVKLADGCGEIAGEGASYKTPDATSKAVLRSSYSSASTHDEIETRAADEWVDSDHLDEDITHIM